MSGVLPTDPPWLKRAFADLGLKETPGKRSNPRIVKMYALAKNAGVKDDSVPWCSAAMNAWIVEAGLHGTKSLLARSWLEWGRAVNTVKKMPRGAVLVFKRGNSSWQGHVCMLLEDNGPTLSVIGGNQSDAVTIARYKRSTLLGARWPVESVPAPTPKPEPVEPAPPPPDVGTTPPWPVPPPSDNPSGAPWPVPPPPAAPATEPDVGTNQPNEGRGLKHWLKRAGQWFTGGGGVGLFAYLTDYRIVLALGAMAIAGVLVWHFFIREKK